MVVEHSVDVDLIVRFGREVIEISFIRRTSPDASSTHTQHMTIEQAEALVSILSDVLYARAIAAAGEEE